jgi:CBS domain-containing protein
MTKARDIMTPGVEVIAADATIEDAARTLAENDIGVVPVCNEDRRLRAMITDRDIVVRVIAAGRDPKTTRAGDVTEPVEIVTIGADDSLDEALATMKQHKVRRLPVIDGHQVVGMISQGDLAANMPEAQVGDLVETISTAP